MLAPVNGERRAGAARRGWAWRQVFGFGNGRERYRVIEVAGARVVGLAAVAVPALRAIAIEHEQRALVGLQDDLGGVLVLAGLVGPLACLQGALEVDLAALLQVLLDHAAKPVTEDRDAVPLGALLALVGAAVLPGLARGEGEARDLVAGLGVADLRVLAEVADQRDLVEASSHDLILSSHPEEASAWRTIPISHFLTHPFDKVCLSSPR